MWRLLSSQKMLWRTSLRSQRFRQLEFCRIASFLFYRSRLENSEFELRKRCFFLRTFTRLRASLGSSPSLFCMSGWSICIRPTFKVQRNLFFCWILGAHIRMRLLFRTSCPRIMTSQCALSQKEPQRWFNHWIVTVSGQLKPSFDELRITLSCSKSMSLCLNGIMWFNWWAWFTINSAHRNFERCGDMLGLKRDIWATDQKISTLRCSTVFLD